MSDPDRRLYACVYCPPQLHRASEKEVSVSAHSTSLRASRAQSSAACSAANVVTEVAEAFSPRYERHGDHLVTIDIRGLDRLLGSPATIGEELRRDAADRGLRAHIAIASTRTAAMVLALSSPGLRVVEDGQEAAALAPIPIGILEMASGFGLLASARRKPGAESLGVLLMPCSMC